MDRAVSSYAPSLKTMDHSRRLKFDLDKNGAKVLVITMAKTPGHASLKGVLEEANAIEAIVPSVVAVVRLDEPSSQKVKEILPSCNIAHFACHGKADATDSLQSHMLFVRYDRQGRPHPDKLTVRDLIASKAANGGVAFLSACSTADKTSPYLADEVIHLACALQLAGFAHVIGTLWAANDKACQIITREFYTSLFGQGLTTPEAADEDTTAVKGHRRVAVAYHTALVALRARYPNSPLLWAPFVHMGG